MQKIITSKQIKKMNKHGSMHEEVKECKKHEINANQTCNLL